MCNFARYSSLQDNIYILHNHYTIKIARDRVQSTKEKFSLSYPMTQLGEATKLHPYPSGPCLDILLTMIMMILQKSWKVKYNGLKSYLQVARPTALRLESPTHGNMSNVLATSWRLEEYDIILTSK